MLPCQEYSLAVAFSLQYRPFSRLIFLACFAGAGYSSQNTGSLAETVKSYIPGTDANRESRYEQGQDSGHDASYTGSGSQGYGSGTAHQGYSSANQGYGSGTASQEYSGNTTSGSICCSTC